jgi:hydroxymethylpyrimidine/phosphomethylpyrimidine kinase
MLATQELVRVTAAAIRDLALTPYVLDPVMVASSGARLLDREAEADILSSLLPLASLVTPNLDEASILAGFSVACPTDMRRAAEALVAAGAGAALMKGGHLEQGEIVDILFDGTNWWEWRRPRMHTRNTHGTGCTLSAAITAGMAHGRSLKRAVEDGLLFVERAMATAPGLGAGHGPLSHLVAGST